MLNPFWDGYDWLATEWFKAINPKLIILWKKEAILDRYQCNYNIRSVDRLIGDQNRSESSSKPTNYAVIQSGNIVSGHTF